jgi:cytochrome c oxidase subunit 2
MLLVNLDDIAPAYGTLYPCHCGLFWLSLTSPWFCGRTDTYEESKPSGVGTVAQALHTSQGGCSVGSSWLPPELTQMSSNVDHLFYIVLGIVAFFFVLVEFLLIFFLIRYRRTKLNQVGAAVHGNNKLEVLWTLIPALILVWMGAISVQYVYEAQTPPANEYTIKVIGHEWYWEFQYPNGLTSRELRVPADQNVLFDITSKDVIHGFYIPAVRVQQDALPGRQTQFYIRVESKDIGKSFPVPCDQFCGAGHPGMLSTMRIMSRTDFDKWLAAELQKQKQGTS